MTKEVWLVKFFNTETEQIIYCGIYPSHEKAVEYIKTRESLKDTRIFTCVPLYAYNSEELENSGIFWNLKNFQKNSVAELLGRLFKWCETEKSGDFKMGYDIHYRLSEMMNIVALLKKEIEE